MNTVTNKKYNTAKLWQIMCFPLNNTATNMFMFMMMYVSYLAVGGYGIAVVLVSSIVTGTRIFDAFTDLLIGFIIDKTKTKVGKFRPMIVIGYVIMVVSVILMYFVAIGSGTLTFILIYMLHIIGYTFQSACTKSAQTCITNDPSQRPLFTRCDSIYMLIQMAGFGVYVSNYLQPKYGELNVAAMQEMAIFSIIVATICTVLAVAALWTKDIPENWGVGDKGTKVSAKDYITVIKENRAIQMLIIAASMGKLAFTAASNSSVIILLFGIIIGNYGFYGKLNFITLIPSVIIILIGTKIAQKRGSKKALVQSSWLSIVFAVVYLGVFFVLEPTKIGSAVVPTTVFLIVHCIFNGVKTISGNIVIPMIADCADYETYLSGRYVPGMMGTLFSAVDKIISSFSTTIVGFLLVMLGYSRTLPQVGDPTNQKLFWVTMFAYLGLPIISWLITIIAMKFYPLDDKKMEEVQEKLAQIRATE